MFLSQRKEKKDEKKGLSSLKIDSITVPTHLNKSELLPASLQYRPESKIPTRGDTELTREDRHSAHLRKKRTLKTERTRKDKMMRSLAQDNQKLKNRMEKEDAIRSLKKNKNVQIIGNGGSAMTMKKRSSSSTAATDSRKDSKNRVIIKKK